MTDQSASSQTLNVEATRKRRLIAAAWVTALIAVSLGMLFVREQLDKAHVALVFLLVVLGGSAQGGRRVGLLLSALAFGIFDYVFLKPYYNLIIANPLDWLALLAYLVVSTVATQLLTRVQDERARSAREAEHTESLREADRAKDALLASISHDLRTPLTTIKAHAHAILADGDDRALVIAEETDRLTRFVTDMLDMTRITEGKLKVTIELVSADDVAAAVIERVSGMPGHERLHVALDTSEPLIVGRFDFVHTIRIVVNLVENALKYSPDGAVVELSIARRGANVEFDVVDNGPGVDVDERELIFAPFYRPHGTPADVAGAGLGLSIARRLADAQGGSLTVHSHATGGSVFRLTLPAADLTEDRLIIPP